MATAKSNVRREMECAVCLDRLRQPKTLPCQHNFCGVCLEGLAQDQKISCPTCRKETALGPGGVGDLPKNIALISIMESFCEQCFYRDRKVCCDHCGLWMCSQCHESCSLAQNLSPRKEAFVQEVVEQELRLADKTSQLMKNFKHAMDQVDARRKEIVNCAETSAQKIKSKILLEQNRQSDALKRMTKGLSGMKKAVTQSHEENSPKEEETECFSEIWKDTLKIYATEISNPITTITFVPEKAVPAMGQILIAPDYENVHFEHTTFGTKGYGAGQFLFPTRIAISPVTKNIIVLDSGNNRIQLFNEQYKFISQFGSEGTSEEKIGFCLKYVQGADGFYSKCHDSSHCGGLCVTDDGLIVVADPGNRRLQVFTQRGKFIRSIGHEKSENKLFQRPNGLTIHDDLIYVCDKGSVRVFDMIGKHLNEIGSDVVFQSAEDVTVCSSGDVVVSSCKEVKRRSSSNNQGKLDKFNESKEHTAIFGAENLSLFKLHRPRGITTDSYGNIIVSDYNTHKVHILTESGKLIRTLGSHGDGPGQLDGPVGVVCSPDGRILVADHNNHRLQVFSPN